LSQRRGIRPRTPVCLRRLGAPPGGAFIPLKKFYCFIYSAQKETSNYCKCFAFAFSALLHLSFYSNSTSFVEGGRKNIFCPKAQAPFYAIGPQFRRLAVLQFGRITVLDHQSVEILSYLTVLLVCCFRLASLRITRTFIAASLLFAYLKFFLRYSAI